MEGRGRGITRGECMICRMFRYLMLRLLLQSLINVYVAGPEPTLCMLPKKSISDFPFTSKSRYPSLKNFHWLYRCCRWSWAGLSRPNTLYQTNQPAFFNSTAAARLKRERHNIPCGRTNQLKMKAKPKVAAKHTNTVCVNFPTVCA